MKIFILNFCMLGILVSANACDPDTEYEKDGDCCKMCGPGTRMNDQPSCKTPVCSTCGQHEYQPGYTRDTKCQLQPVCDPNMNLEQDPLKPTVRVPCKCKAGHHWTSEERLNCVRNTACEPGRGVIKTATDFSDTVCQACGQGTFSNETSASDPCHSWTKCDRETHRIKKEGTLTSDVECEEISSHVGLAVGICVLALFILAAAVGIFIFLKKGCPDRLKNCVGQECWNAEEGHPRNQPAPPNQLLLEKQVPQQDPEENEDTNHPVQVTDNNKPLMQEVGKEERTSQPETDGTSLPDSGEGSFLTSL